MKVQNINISQENIFQISNNPLDIVTKINSKVSLSKEELKILVNQIKVEENREKRIEYVDLLDEVSNNQGEIFENVLSDLEKLVENKDEVLVDKILGIFYGLSFGNDKLKIKNIAIKALEKALVREDIDKIDVLNRLVSLCTNTSGLKVSQETTVYLTNLLNGNESLEIKNKICNFLGIKDKTILSKERFGLLANSIENNNKKLRQI